MCQVFKLSQVFFVEYFSLFVVGFPAFSNNDIIAVSAGGSDDRLWWLLLLVIVVCCTGAERPPK